MATTTKPGTPVRRSTRPISAESPSRAALEVLRADRSLIQNKDLQERPASRGRIGAAPPRPSSRSQTRASDSNPQLPNLSRSIILDGQSSDQDSDDDEQLPADSIEHQSAPDSASDASEGRAISLETVHHQQSQQSQEQAASHHPLPDHGCIHPTAMPTESEVRAQLAGGGNSCVPASWLAAAADDEQELVAFNFTGTERLYRLDSSSSSNSSSEYTDSNGTSTTSISRDSSRALMLTDQEAGPAADSAGASPQLVAADLQRTTSTTSAASGSSTGTLNGNTFLTQGRTDAIEATGPSYLTILQKQLEIQQGMKSELGHYLADLVGRCDEAGEKLVDMPRNFNVLVEQLLAQRRHEYASLQGWLGPRRFEDLPIAQLSMDHPDPKVSAGLAAIAELDQQLKDVAVEAMAVSRQVFPQQWAERERRRLEQHSHRVAEALKRERHKLRQAAKLARAVAELEGEGSDTHRSTSDDGSSTVEGSVGSHATSAATGYRAFMRQLAPEEEELVEKVLHRPEPELDCNPFDLHTSVVLPGEVGQALHLGGPSPGAQQQSAAAGEGGLPVAVVLAMIDEKLAQYAVEHPWGQEHVAQVAKRSAPSSPGLSRCNSATSASQQNSTLATPRSQPSSSRMPSAAAQPTAAAPKRGVASDTHTGSTSSAADVATTDAPASTDIASTKPDYLRQQREQRELLRKAADVDAKLRAVRVAELPAGPLAPDVLQQLLQECLRRKAAVEAALESRPCSGSQRSSSRAMRCSSSLMKAEGESRSSSRRGSSTGSLPVSRSSSRRVTASSIPVLPAVV